jgi:hypothetical protein
MSKVTLTVQSPQGDRRVRVAGECLTIGRGNGVDLRVDDQGLSRTHASVRRDGGAVWFLDEGSRNGSFVNGEPVPADGRSLADGDEITIGDGTMIVVNIAREDSDGARDEQPARANGVPRRPLVAALVLTAVAVSGAAFAARLTEDGRHVDARPTNTRDSYRAGQPAIPDSPGAGTEASDTVIVPPESASNAADESVPLSPTCTAAPSCPTASS